MEYAIDKLEDLGLRNLAKLVLEKEEQIVELQEENKQLKERIDKAIEILGEYKHYSVPDEKQNSENEDIVDKFLEILKGGNNDNTNNN